MSAQPEALRLVNSRQNAHLVSWQANACSELRRLHALNAELLKALKLAGKNAGNAEAVYKVTRDAIAKAEGQA